ncbi:SprT-like domain-containing protein [Pseudorhodoferax sp. Leaf267]|jgi:hypothetical protein|uniref:SprT-like domain-containing protein n=1 Tax=Pseudorhodoferax sp. Leaf267 TaxID=1736316 RepID=UPI0006FBCE78|nr:SprT-like domain-containing protein [Pseudorhodoferax sp. Leaf267]KQP14781.1 zinc metalloprotease [Pseudorhodoferax sp. Leaf267]
MLQAARSVPTRETYDELQVAYSHFNARLFDGALPDCLITLQREKSTCGYFSAKRFARADGETTDEIALNPSYFAAVPLVETMQTLVHEMVHLWQHHYGAPGRVRYHNEEWAAKMEGIGLMPSSTGRPGGKRTGDKMSDYAVEGGPFLLACAELLTLSFNISWYDRFPAVEHVRFGESSLSAALPAAVGGGAAPLASHALLAGVMHASVSAAQDGAAGVAAANKSNRTKYVCGCRSAVWGKPGLVIRCGVCDEAFEPQ